MYAGAGKRLLDRHEHGRVVVARQKAPELHRGKPASRRACISCARVSGVSKWTKASSGTRSRIRLRAPFGHGRILHGLRGGDVVALQITPAGLEGTAHLGEQRRFLQNGIMMQRFKGNRGIKAAFSQIAGKIVCAKQGEPFSGVLAASRSSMSAERSTPVTDRSGKRLKMGSSSSPVPQPRSRSVQMPGGSSRAIQR